MQSVSDRTAATGGSDGTSRKHADAAGLIGATAIQLAIIGRKRVRFLISSPIEEVKLGTTSM
jgi:hypothetical protein